MDEFQLFFIFTLYTVLCSNSAIRDYVWRYLQQKAGDDYAYY
jgi:hypothetical protein